MLPNVVPKKPLNSILFFLYTVNQEAINWDITLISAIFFANHVNDDHVMFRDERIPRPSVHSSNSTNKGAAEPSFCKRLKKNNEI